MKFGTTLTKSVARDFKVGLIPALLGQAGIGKSSFFEALAEEWGTKCFTVACNLMDNKADLTGARLMEDTDPNTGAKTYKQAYFPHEDIDEAIDYAIAHPDETPVLFLDEINRGGVDVASGSLGLATARKIGRRRLPDNLLVAVAGNDTGNIVTLDEAALSRFSLYKVEPDADTFLGLTQNLNAYIRTVLENRPELIVCSTSPREKVTDEDGNTVDDAVPTDFLLDAQEEMKQITVPRTLTYLSHWLNDVSRQELTELMSVNNQIKAPGSGHIREVSELVEIIEGKIGNTEFSVELISVIGEDIRNNTPGSGAGAAAIVTRTTEYDRLIAASSRTDIEAIIASMSADALGNTLLYALTDSRDNTDILAALELQITTLTADHNRMLVQILSANAYDNQNMETLRNSNSTLAQTLSPVLSMF